MKTFRQLAKIGDIVIAKIYWCEDSNGRAEDFMGAVNAYYDVEKEGQYKLEYMKPVFRTIQEAQACVREACGHAANLVNFTNSVVIQEQR